MKNIPDRPDFWMSHPNGRNIVIKSSHSCDTTGLLVVWDAHDEVTLPLSASEMRGVAKALTDLADKIENGE